MQTVGALLLVLVILLAGCAGPQTVLPSQSTLSEVRARLGTPSDIRFDREGDELWEYARGPMGTETFLIRADKGGRVKSVTQLLTEAQFGKIVPGQMSKADVRHLLGRPSDESFLYNGTSWSWRVDLRPQTGYFVVHFDPNDIVLDKIIIFDVVDGPNQDGRGSHGGHGGHGGGRGR